MNAPSNMVLNKLVCKYQLGKTTLEEDLKLEKTFLFRAEVDAKADNIRLTLKMPLLPIREWDLDHSASTNDLFLFCSTLIPKPDRYRQGLARGVLLSLLLTWLQQRILPSGQLRH